MRRYWYSILLMSSIIIMATASLSPASSLSAQPAAGREAAGESGAERALSSAGEEAEVSASGTGREAEAPAPDAAEDFSNVLFIGDSRTVGLSEYGNLGKAEVFASSGMSVFNVFDSKAVLKSGDKQTLDQVLSSGSFQTVYLMLGINELGYEEQSIVRQYRAVVDRVRASLPEAVLVLEANLHVTREKSDVSSIYNNRRIDSLNRAIQAIAEETGCRYIDVNPLFDDESGSLSAAYSTDGAHILGKYYSVWVEWLRDSRRAAPADAQRRSVTLPVTGN